MKEQYEPTWTSLRKHQTPQWLIDAKFGIYCHWGPSSIRYQAGNEDLTFEQAIEKFTAEKFDAQAWAMLFKRAGARFGAPIAWHGSPFLHWDSDIYDFNSVKHNPHIDIMRELAREVRAQGMKFVATFHAIGGDTWIARAKEGVDKYSPEFFWVDASFGGTKGAHHQGWLHNSRYTGEGPTNSRMLHEKYQREFLAYYFNHAIANDKKVEFIYKSFDIPPGVGMRDLENGLLNDIAYDVWMTDIDMNVPPDWATHGWFYRESVPQRSANSIINMLVDVVSKNGLLLLNVPPLADGMFAEDIQRTLEDVGDWLTVNGEAIYGTSPWFIYGEGPTQIPDRNGTWHHNNHFDDIQFTAEDIRFTVNGNNLYAICLGKPGDTVTINALNSSYKLKQGDIESISMLGSDAPLTWEHTESALVIHLPDEKPGDSAVVFKIELSY